MNKHCFVVKIYEPKSMQTYYIATGGGYTKNRDRAAMHTSYDSAETTRLNYASSNTTVAGYSTVEAYK